MFSGVHMSENRAKAKALMLTELMRVAGDEGCTPTAQAVLAIVIAESWPNKKHWCAKLGYPVLEHRLGVARNTIRKATRELELANLVRMKPGSGQRISLWQLPNIPSNRGSISTPGGGNLRPLRGSTSTPPGVNLRPRGGQSQHPQRVNLEPPIQDNKIYSGATV